MPVQKCETIMRKPSIAPLVAALLFLVAALTLLRAVEARSPVGREANSSVAISLVRAYYAAVETYFQSGDLSGVSALFESSDEAAEIEWRLRALRANYPLLAIEVVDLLVERESVTARIMVDAGPPGAAHPIQPLHHLRSWQMSETFRVRGDRISEHAYAGPGLGLFVPQTTLSVGRFPAGGMTLLTARLTLRNSHDSYVALPGPALVTVEAGTIEVRGNGVVSLMSTDGAAPVRLEPDTVALSGSNDTLVSGNAKIVIRNGINAQTTLLVAILAPNESPPRLAAEHADHRPGSGFAFLAGSGVLVEPLGVSELLDGPIGQMSVGWVVLDPASAAITNDDTRVPYIFSPRAQLSIKWDSSTGRPTVSNTTLDQLIVWAILIA